MDKIHYMKRLLVSMAYQTLIGIGETRRIIKTILRVGYKNIQNRIF